MLSDLTISMAGSGRWRTFFPDDEAYGLYRRLYFDGLGYRELTEEERTRAETWEEPEFARMEGERVVPLIPVMTLPDYDRFQGWFQAASENAGRVLSEVIECYRSLAERLADDGVSADDILTILICGHTLDVGTLRELERGIMGEPPERAGSGSYFIWGKEVRSFSRYHFGVNSMGLDQFSLQYLWGREIKRVARGKSIRIPVFDQEAMKEVEDLCGATSRKLAEAFTAGVKELEAIVPKATFSQCARGDTLCMLFHIGYERMAETLVSMGLLPDFPEEVDDAWGTWVRWQA